MPPDKKKQPHENACAIAGRRSMKDVAGPQDLRTFDRAPSPLGIVLVPSVGANENRGHRAALLVELNRHRNLRGYRLALQKARLIFPPTKCIDPGLAKYRRTRDHF